jgi:hypothetical protein
MTIELYDKRSFPIKIFKRFLLCETTISAKKIKTRYVQSVVKKSRALHFPIFNTCKSGFSEF